MNYMLFAKMDQVFRLDKNKTLKNTGKWKIILEHSRNFVSPEKWEPWYMDQKDKWNLYFTSTPNIDINTLKGDIQLTKENWHILKEFLHWKQEYLDADKDAYLGRMLQPGSCGVHLSIRGECWYDSRIN